MNKTLKTGLQFLGLVAWATVWIGGGLWLAFIGTRQDSETTYDKE